MSSPSPCRSISVLLVEDVLIMNRKSGFSNILTELRWVPEPHTRSFVYSLIVALFDPSRSEFGQVDVNLINNDDNALIARATVVFTVSGTGSKIGFAAFEAALPAPGWYTFDVIVDGKVEHSLPVYARNLLEQAL